MAALIIITVVLLLWSAGEQVAKAMGWRPEPKENGYYTVAATLTTIWAVAWLWALAFRWSF